MMSLILLFLWEMVTSISKNCYILDLKVIVSMEYCIALVHRGRLANIRSMAGVDQQS